MEPIKGNDEVMSSNRPFGQIGVVSFFIVLDFKKKSFIIEFLGNIEFF